MLGQRITPGVAHRAEPRSHLYIKQRHCPQSAIALSQFNRAPFSLTYDLLLYDNTLFWFLYLPYLCGFPSIHAFRSSLLPSYCTNYGSSIASEIFAFTWLVHYVIKTLQVKEEQTKFLEGGGVGQELVGRPLPLK